MKPPFPNFFFGATSRPFHIGLSADFTYFGLRYCDCSGLMIEPDDMAPHQGINLRTAEQVSRCGEWLRQLASEPRGTGLTEDLHLPGFSPEFADESFEDKYDATELHLYGVWRNDPEEGVCFHLAASIEPDPDEPGYLGLDATGIPLELMPAFADALDIIAETMESDTLDLTKDQPLSE